MVKETKWDLTANILVIIGAINWLLVGLFSIDVVEALFSSIPFLQKIVYILVGVGGLYKFFNLFMD